MSRSSSGGSSRSSSSCSVNMDEPEERLETRSYDILSAETDVRLAHCGVDSSTMSLCVIRVQKPLKFRSVLLSFARSLSSLSSARFTGSSLSSKLRASKFEPRVSSLPSFSVPRSSLGFTLTFAPFLRLQYSNWIRCNPEDEKFVCLESHGARINKTLGAMRVRELEKI